MRLAKLVVSCSVLMFLLACSSTEKLLRTPKVDSDSVLLPYDVQTYKNSVHTFDAIDLMPTIERERWLRRVDYIFVLWDEAGIAGPETDAMSPKVLGREILRRLNETLPSSGLSGALLTTGSGQPFSSAASADTYDPKAIESQLNKRQGPLSLGGGNLAPRIDALTEWARLHPGRTAIYLITQWDRLDANAIEAIARFHQRTVHGSGLTLAAQGTRWSGKDGLGGCFYAIGVGNTYSREKFLDVSDCGLGATFDAIAQPRDMANFVSRTLFSGPSDTDGDGIPDYLDECPNTPPGRLVNSKGCLRFPDSKVD
ncbi:thrombospondin type 3 repeat-containing protein [Rhodoferax sp.]|uniref:thrombospondin type 3 repeat-containing protein n=1 Tax=Rhodoferax sp. TaxID=50421 RepID=UPI0025FCF491|nr:thrombospondin type 3 repeat-containing protein [Rhodoferax sp.]